MLNILTGELKQGADKGDRSIVSALYVPVFIPAKVFFDIKQKNF